jgi:MFS family permease
MLLNETKENMIKFIAVVPILAVSILMNSFMTVVPILAEIQKSFPMASASEIQLIYTIVSLFSLFTMLLSGKLVHYFSKKTLLLAGIGIMFTGGILPSIFHQNLPMLYIFSSVFGIGMGLHAVISSALISDYFKGINKGKIMGMQAAIASFGGAVMSAGSGFIAANSNWKFSYLMYLICVPLFLLVLFILPRDKKIPKEVAKKGGINGRLIYFVLLNLFLSICINVFHSNNAMFLEETGLGNAAVAGTVQFIFMITGIPVGLSLGLCIKFFGKNIMGMASFFMALGMFFIAFSHSLPAVYAGAFLVGVGFSIKAPGGLTFITNMVSANSAAMAIALNNAFGSVGNFISPIVVNPAARMMGGGPNRQFIISSIALVFISLLYIFLNPIKKEEISSFQ